MRILLVFFSLVVVSCAATIEDDKVWTQLVVNTEWVNTKDNLSARFDGTGRTVTLSTYDAHNFILDFVESPTCAIYRSEFFVEPPEWFLINIEPINNVTNLVVYGPFIELFEINKDEFLQTNYIKAP